MPWLILASVGYRQSDLGQIDARNRDIAEMYRYLEQTGYQVDIPTLRRRFPEATWTTFADWARQAVR